jgi:hypothetical protein
VNGYHSHNRPLGPKEFRFGYTGANIRDSANDLAFYFSNNDFSNIGKRRHVSDLCPKRWTIVVRVFELLKGQQRQSNAELGSARQRSGSAAARSAVRCNRLLGEAVPGNITVVDQHSTGS